MTNLFDGPSEKTLYIGKQICDLIDNKKLSHPEVLEIVVPLVFSALFQLYEQDMIEAKMNIRVIEKMLKDFVISHSWQEDKESLH
jgi:hypothetical protein